jgi:hypothetical protein
MVPAAKALRRRPQTGDSAGPEASGWHEWGQCVARLSEPAKPGFKAPFGFLLWLHCSFTKRAGCWKANPYWL